MADFRSLLARDEELFSAPPGGAGGGEPPPDDPLDSAYGSPVGDAARRQDIAFGYEEGPPSSAEIRRSREGERMQSARDRNKDHDLGFADWAARMVPIGSSLADMIDTDRYKEAADAIARGKAQDWHYDVVAQHERVQEKEATSGYGRKILTTAAYIPAIVGEGVMGGAALGNFGRAAQGASRLNRLGNLGVRSAALTPLLPSMYASRAARNAVDNGGSWADLENLAPALAVGTMYTAILGQVANRVPGEGIGNYLGRVAVGVGEANAVTYLTRKAGLQNDSYGAIHGLLHGEGKPALEDLTAEVVAFGIFGMMHQGGRDPVRALDGYREALDKAKAQGLRPEAAERLLRPVADRLLTELHRRRGAMSRESALELFKDLPEKSIPGQFARDLVRTLPETPEIPFAEAVPDPSLRRPDPGEVPSRGEAPPSPPDRLPPEPVAPTRRPAPQPMSPEEAAAALSKEEARLGSLPPNARDAGLGRSAPGSSTSGTESPLVEPPPPGKGMVRFYHGGSGTKGGNRWLSPDRDYAEGYADKSSEGKVSFVDIPEDSPLLMKAFDDSGTTQKAPFTSFEAPPDVASRLREIPRRRLPRAEEPPPATPATPRERADALTAEVRDLTEKINDLVPRERASGQRVETGLASREEKSSHRQLRKELGRLRGALKRREKALSEARDEVMRETAKAPEAKQEPPAEPVPSPDPTQAIASTAEAVFVETMDGRNLAVQGVPVGRVVAEGREIALEDGNTVASAGVRRVLKADGTVLWERPAQPAPESAAPPPTAEAPGAPPASEPPRATVVPTEPPIAPQEPPAQRQATPPTKPGTQSPSSDLFDRFVRGEPVPEAKLTDNQAAVLNAFLGDTGQDLATLGRRMGVTKQAIKKTLDKALSKLGVDKTAADLQAEMRAENRQEMKGDQGRETDLSRKQSDAELNRQPGESPRDRGMRVWAERLEKMTPAERKAETDKVTAMWKRSPAEANAYFDGMAREGGKPKRSGRYKDAEREKVIQATMDVLDVNKADKDLLTEEGRKAVEARLGRPLHAREFKAAIDELRVQQEAVRDSLRAGHSRQMPGSFGGEKAQPPGEFQLIATQALLLGHPEYVVDRLPVRDREARGVALSRERAALIGRQAAGNALVRLEEIIHVESFKRGFPPDPTSLPAEVAAGYKQFDYDPTRPLGRAAMYEGFADYLIRRTTGQLSSLTPEQRAAAQHAEAFLKQSGLDSTFNRLQELYRRHIEASPKEKARGLLSATAKPALAGEGDEGLGGRQALVGGRAHARPRAAPPHGGEGRRAVPLPHQGRRPGPQGAVGAGRRRNDPRRALRGDRPLQTPDRRGRRPQVPPRRADQGVRRVGAPQGSILGTQSRLRRRPVRRRPAHRQRTRPRRGPTAPGQGRAAPGQAGPAPQPRQDADQGPAAAGRAGQAGPPLG
jgi:hypothetical protein